MQSEMKNNCAIINVIGCVQIKFCRIELLDAAHIACAADTICFLSEKFLVIKLLQTEIKMPHVMRGFLFSLSCCKIQRDVKLQFVIFCFIYS